MNIALVIIYYFINILLIRRDRIYLIPFIFSFSTNVFGLLDSETISLPFGLDYRDIGLISILVLIVIYRRALARYKRTVPYIIAVFYLVYLAFLFAYSYYIDDVNFIESIKIGRQWLYGLLFILALQLISRKNCFENYRILINFLYTLTVLLTILYIIQNQFNIDIFGAQDYEVILHKGTEARRNFYAYPFFSAFCTIYSLNSLIEATSHSKRFVHFMAYLILMLGTIYVLTRGLIITSITLSTLLILYRRFNINNTLIVFLILFSAIIFFNSGFLARIHSYEVLLDRMTEVTNSGISETDNFKVRSYHFFNAVNNVVTFNPLFGFGYTLPAEFGYSFMLYHAGNPDNAFANIIGVQGFFGLLLFLLLLMSWLFVNIKLQIRFSDPFTKIHFFVFLWLIMTAFNSNTISFLDNFCLFFAYDLIIYSMRVRTKSKNKNLLSV